MLFLNSIYSMDNKKIAFFASFRFAFNGLKVVWLERNFKFHLVSTFIAILMGFVFKISHSEWMIILFCIALVLSLEILNTAIEYLVDLVSPEFNEKAGRVKDIAAAAVLTASIVVLIIALIVFIPYMV